MAVARQSRPLIDGDDQGPALVLADEVDGGGAGLTAGGVEATTRSTRERCGRCSPS